MSKTTRVVILQPSYIPWVGAFEMLARSDIFVFYDDVQYDRDGWRNRNRIKTQTGTQWLTVPAHGDTTTLIKDVKIAGDTWHRKHIETLKQAYAKAPHAHDVLEQLEFVITRYGADGAYLAKLNEMTLHALASWGGASGAYTPRSSDLGIAGAQTERLVAICQRLGATHYLSGPAARAYLDAAQFEAAGITLEWHEFVPAEYPQLHGPFVSHLSFLDLVLNCGKDSWRYLNRR